MNHPTAEELLDHVIGTTPSVGTHLEGCPECRAAEAPWRETDRALGALYDARPAVPEGLADRLLGRLPKRRSAGISLGRIVPFAAALLCCVLVLLKVASQPVPTPGTDAKPRPSEWIAYVESTPRKGETQKVWLLNPNTGEKRLVTNDFGKYESPTFSPDGRTIAFINGSDVSISDVDHPAPRPLPLPPDLYSTLAFSPDSARLLCGTGVMIWLVELRGGAPPERLLGSGARIRKATFSTDGTRILYLSSYTAERSTFVGSMDLHGKSPQVIFSPAGLDFANVSRELAVHPDGKRIVFGRQNQATSFSVLISNLDGTGMRELDTIVSPTYIASPDPVVSPDGRTVVYLNARTKSLWVVDLGSFEQRELVPRAVAEDSSRPAFSPDGQKVAFISKANSNAELWTIDLDGKNPKRLGNVAWESRIAWGRPQP